MGWPGRAAYLAKYQGGVWRPLGIWPDTNSRDLRRTVFGQIRKLIGMTLEGRVDVPGRSMGPGKCIWPNTEEGTGRCLVFGQIQVWSEKRAEGRSSSQEGSNRQLRTSRHAPRHAQRREPVLQTQGDEPPNLGTGAAVPGRRGQAQPPVQQAEVLSASTTRVRPSERSTKKTNGSRSFTRFAPDGVLYG